MTPMLRTMTVALTLTMLAGCGTALNRPTQAAPPTARALAAADPFAALHDLAVKDGGPSDWYTKTKRHVAAKTSKNGSVWVLDNGDKVEVLHNTQTVTNAKKLATIANSMRDAAKDLESEDQKYVFMLASRVEWSIPGVR